MPDAAEASIARGLHRVTIGAVAVALALYLGLAWLHQFRLAPMAGGLQSPDVHIFGYTAETLTRWIEALGRDGRIDFLRLHTFFLDLVFPPAFAFASALVAWRVGTGIGWIDRMAALRRLVLVVVAPAFYLGFDWAENFAIARMVADPMTVNAASAADASFYTVGKWIFVVLTLAVPATFLLVKRRQAGR